MIDRTLPDSKHFGESNVSDSVDKLAEDLMSIITTPKKSGNQGE